MPNGSSLNESGLSIVPLPEGNTRTTAVFIERYLNTAGFQVDNTLFAEHARYFRNALVRANYANYREKIDVDMGFLSRFFENLLMGGDNLLRNRDMILGEKEKKAVRKIGKSCCKRSRQ